MYTLLSPIHNGLSVLVRELEEFIKQTALDTVKPLLANNVRFSLSLSLSLSVCLSACLSEFKECIAVIRLSHSIASVSAHFRCTLGISSGI